MNRQKKNPLYRRIWSRLVIVIGNVIALTHGKKHFSLKILINVCATACAALLALQQVFGKWRTQCAIIVHQVERRK